MEIEQYLEKCINYARVKFVAETKEDYIYLKKIICQVEEYNVDKKRIIDAQKKMHKAIRETVQIRNSKVIKFLSRLGIIGYDK